MTEIIPIKKVEILSTEEAEAFRTFRRHREKFDILLQAGVFDLAYGKVTVSMHNRQIQAVNVDNQTYRRETKGV